MENLSDASVTVGIPVYNEEKYLKETINSVINQTYKNINIIISDNNSTDSSYSIAQEFANRYNNVTAIKHKENIGASNNFKYSLDEAKTEYFMWLGAHDIISESYIEDSVNYLNDNQNVVLVYHDAVFFEDDINNIAECANSDIDTMGLNTESRMYKVFSKLYYCTMIHGVFRTEVAKKLPIKKMISPDHLMLFAAAEMGHIRNIKKLGFYRRNIHASENENETFQRYQEYKVYKFSDNNPYILSALNHIKCVLFSKKLKIFSKLKLIAKIKRDFSVAWSQLLKQTIIKE